MPKRNLSPVEHIKVRKGMSVDELADAMRKSGVLGAGKLGIACEISKAMVEDKDCRVFLGIAGPMVPGGMKEIIHDFISLGLIDALVTTGATLTHDLGEALGYRHYQGNPNADDEKLEKQGIDRIYDSFMPNEVYQGLEEFFKKALPKLPQKEMSISEFLSELGRLAPEKSIIGLCALKKIPLFCPALPDSGIGLQLWAYQQKNPLKISATKDLNEIIDLVWTSKKTGVIYVGGGVPKNYIQQALQVSKSADYGVQITTDHDVYGGSSGADLKEGISWGKMKPKARFVTLHCDATIALPIVLSAIKSG